MKQMPPLFPALLQVKSLTKPIGVYIHIPFCNKKCAYCDFYSVAVHKDTKDSYINSLKKEIYRWGAKLCRPADTVYFGGGTPSVLSSNELCDLLLAVKDAFDVKDDAEITVELNPENIDFEFLNGLKKGGFNRLSFGVQTFSDEILEVLGRRHSAQDSINAVSLARKAGFDNISLDIMLGIPDQKEDDLVKTLEKTIEISPEHISAYMLILEEKTAFFAKKDSLNFPNEDEVSRQYEKTCEILSKNGYNHYEISNFSKKEKESRHNVKYWNCDEFIGIGPSAYSFIDGKRFYYESNMHKFIKEPEVLYNDDGGDIYEYVMLSLRLKKGINEDEIKIKYLKKFSDKFKIQAKQLEENGFAVFKSNSLALTDKGMLVSNTLICDFLEEDMYENL